MNFLTNSTYQSDIRQAAGIDFPWELLEGKRILLTGATGMIASVIIDILMSRNKNIPQSSQRTCIIAVSRNAEKAKQRFAQYWDDTLFTYLSHDITLPLPELGTVDYILHAAHMQRIQSEQSRQMCREPANCWNMLINTGANVSSSFLPWKSTEKTEMMQRSLMSLI